MAETLAQLNAKLTSVQAAIAAIEGGSQEISQDGKGSLTRAPIGVLYKREERLLRQIARAEQTGGQRSHAEF